MGTIKTLTKTAINVTGTSLSYTKGIANATADYIASEDSWLHGMATRSVRDNHIKFRDIGEAHGKTAIDFTVDAGTSVLDTLVDAFSDDKPVAPKATGYGSFGRK